MIWINDGSGDGIGAGPFLSTVRSTCCGRSLEGHLTLAWKANGVHPHPSISPRWVHPSLPSTIPWQIGSPRDSFLVSFAHSRHQPIDHECSSRQVGGVSGPTTRAPSQCSFPSTAKACYRRAPYEATLAVVAHGLASPDFRQLFCTLYRHVSLDRITSPQSISAPPAQRWAPPKGSSRAESTPTSLLKKRLPSSSENGYGVSEKKVFY